MDEQVLDKDTVVINVKEGTVTVSSERFEELERAEMAYIEITTKPIFKIGDKVVTPLGEGKLVDIKSIEFQVEFIIDNRGMGNDVTYAWFTFDQVQHSNIKPSDIKWTLAELNNLLQHNLSNKLSRTVKKLISRFARLYKKENDYVMTRDTFLLGLGLIITTTEYIPHAKLDIKTRDILDGLCYVIVKRENEEQ